MWVIKIGVSSTCKYIIYYYIFVWRSAQAAITMHLGNLVGTLHADIIFWLHYYKYYETTNIYLFYEELNVQGEISTNKMLTIIIITYHSSSSQMYLGGDPWIICGSHWSWCGDAATP